MAQSRRPLASRGLLRKDKPAQQVRAESRAGSKLTLGQVLTFPEFMTNLPGSEAAWAAGQSDEAEMACRQVLAVWPGQTDAAYLLGLMAYTYGYLDLAIAIAHVREAR